MKKTHVTPINVSFCSRGKLRKLIQICTLTSLTAPTIVSAQQEPQIEELVVTGSYIRNSAFAQNSPVDTVTQADLYESGAPNMSAYIKDLSYTQNTNAVNNVLGSSSGPATGVAASFNLRGLGENSTLTLIDGARSLSSSISSVLPEIAIDRMELVLDGGSALYGSDAVAGVVNIIPIKQFEGLRVRSYYQVTDESGMENFNNSILWGRSFDNGIDYVGAYEFQKRTSLMMFERPRENVYATQVNLAGNPGSFKPVTGLPEEMTLYQKHGGVASGNTLLDPSCGTFNEGSPAHGTGPRANPSGVELNYGNDSYCIFDYSVLYPYAYAEDDHNLYNSISIEANDWLRLNLTVNNHWRVNDTTGMGTVTNGGNSRNVAFARADHPANPFGIDVVPWNWHVFAQAYTHMPENFTSFNANADRIMYNLNRTKFSAEYDIAGSWTGYTYYSHQNDRASTSASLIDTGKLQLALDGKGGPNGNEYFNPFGSSDPRSPYFEEGVTSNSKEMTEWLWYHYTDFVTSRNELDVLESVVTGDVFELPAGTVQAAFGYQYRGLRQNTFAERNEVAQPGINFTRVGVGSPKPTDGIYPSDTESFFFEVQVPILETLDAQIAVRDENFKTFGIGATSPKISLRWEALPNLALRGSWGESFVAPSPYEARRFIADENCSDLFIGTDPLSGTLLGGGLQCSSGNPNLQPESSTIQNIGFTWEPEGTLSGLHLSMDYQEIEYTDRIRSLSAQDTIDYQFTRMLAATGISESNYNPTPGTSTRAAADAWLTTQLGLAGNQVERYSNNSVAKVFRQSNNVSSVWVNLLDVTARYTFDTNGLGSFTTTTQMTYYKDYEYASLDGVITDALGKQNYNTGIVPPLPQFKMNVRLNWFRDNHSASLSANYWDTLEWDAPIFNFFPGERTLTTPDKLDGEMIVDARYGILLDQFLDSEFTVSAGINNLFDQRPQTAGILNGFESRLSTPWGRQFWVSLEWSGLRR